MPIFLYNGEKEDGEEMEKEGVPHRTRSKEEKLKIAKDVVKGTVLLTHGNELR